MSDPAPWRLAACQYPIDVLTDFKAYSRKLERLTAEAVAAGARLLLFPEYGSMELTSLFPPEVRCDPQHQIEDLQALLPDFRALHRTLACRCSLYIVAASVPVRVEPGRFHNRAYVFGPNGREDFQDKLTMTRFETERWGIAAGSEIKVFETALGGIAINICYDSEFPLFARRQVEEGAEVILVPSCTDALSGHSRVRIGARARALENQCFVAMSPTVGSAPWSPVVDENVGAAGVFAPPDRSFASDGVLASGTLNEPGWVYAEIDLSALANLRADPEVFNRRDWSGQTRPTLTITRSRL